MGGRGVIMNKLSVCNPNFSIVVPSACNANCSFCFWNREVIEVNKKRYLENLWDVINNLPDDFTQCSITGGEPTMLPWLRGILLMVRGRFDKVVLSTNGWKLKTHMYIATDNLIDHLNISRHDIGLKANCQAFNSARVIPDEELREVSEAFQRNGIDTTLNCVLPSTCNDLKFIRDYIKYAKSLSANAVAFRKDHSDLEFMGVENSPFMSKIIDSHSCPVCRNDVRLIDGMTTTWKYSVKEPSVDLGGIYELIYHQDSRLTADWNGINLINTSDIIPYMEDCDEKIRQ
jgi:molybdenum cofactor biosynthesis enzyme MoaA